MADRGFRLPIMTFVRGAWNGMVCSMGLLRAACTLACSQLCRLSSLSLCTAQQVSLPL